MLDPLWNLRPTRVREPRELTKVSDWHNTWNDWNTYSTRMNLVNKCKIRIRIIKILSYCPICSSVDFFNEIVDNRKQKLTLIDDLELIKSELEAVIAIVKK